MPLKCHIYATHAIWFMCIYKTTMSVYISHMNLMQSIMLPEALVYIQSKLLTYATEQISMPHCTICSTALLLYSTYRFHITAHIHQTSVNCNFNLPYYCTIWPSNKYAPQMPTDNANAKILLCVSIREVCQYTCHI